MNELVEAIVYYAVFLFSVTLHEASHAWAAKRGGDLTAYLGGQVSLDPVDRKSTRLNSSHMSESRMPSSA